MRGVAIARTLSKEPMRGEAGTAGDCTVTLAGTGRRRRAGNGRALARRPARSGDAEDARGLGETSLSDAAAIGARASGAKADEVDCNWIQSWVDKEREEVHGVIYSGFPGFRLQTLLPLLLRRPPNAISTCIFLDVSISNSPCCEAATYRIGYMCTVHLRVMFVTLRCFRGNSFATTGSTLLSARKSNLATSFFLAVTTNRLLGFILASHVVQKSTEILC